MESNLWHTALPGSEFDYLALMGVLADYKRPRDKVTKLLKHKDIIRIKKGLYVLGKKLRRDPVNRELLGNLIYGPSYISLEYALSMHQLIPERAETVTSVTLNKTKSFSTPMGNFTYRHVKSAYYSLGQYIQFLPDGRSYLLACPEKALADKVYFSNRLYTVSDLKAYLFDDLRIDYKDFAGLDADFFQELADAAGKRPLTLLAETARGKA